MHTSPNGILWVSVFLTFLGPVIDTSPSTDTVPKSMEYLSPAIGAILQYPARANSPLTGIRKVASG